MRIVYLTATWIGLVLLLGLLAGWAFMLFVMVLHNWLSGVPTIGYLNAVALVLAARVVGAPFEIRRT